MNFSILIGLVIILAGIFFRILPYDNVQGLWNDEYMGWFISQKPLLVEFVKGVISQCHMPLYYLYLKMVTSVFGNSDLTLRLSSFVIGFASIIVMYFVGALKDKKTGALCALFTAVSGFLIYYSYEVRPYILIFLFSALSLLFSIKLLNNTTKKNLIWYCIFNVLILITHTIGFVYVIANLLFVGHFLNQKNRSYMKYTMLFTSACCIIVTPLVLYIFTTISFSQWWNNFTFSKICFLFTDFYSNYLVNLITAPASFINSIGWAFFIFGIIPATIAIAGLVNSIFEEKQYTKSLLLVTFSTIFVIFLASIFGKIVFTSKYLIEIYPIMILLSMIGLDGFKNKKLRISLLVIFFVLNLSFLATDHFKNKFIKAESNKLVAELLQNANLHENDTIIFTYYPQDRFEKYFDFKNFKTYEINKGNFNYYLTPNTSYKQAVVLGEKIYKPIYTSNVNSFFDKKLNEEIYSKINSGDKVAIVFLNSVEIFSDVQIFTIAIQENIYQRTPQMFMIFSYIKNELLKKSTKEFKFIKYEQKGDWSVAVFEKP